LTIDVRGPVAPESPPEPARRGLRLRLPGPRRERRDDGRLLDLRLYRSHKAGVPGRVGDSTLQVVRPSFGLTPASRAMTFTLGDGASWFLVSSGWGKAELRRADVDGPPVFRRGSVALEVDDSITADEVALLLVCEVSAPYVYVKILARVLAITSYV
jgi:hypothetical protein